MTEFKQTIIITVKDEAGEMSASYVANDGLKSDPLFWEWFYNVWPMLGMNFVKKGLKDE